jgi:hypothetical protein
MKHDDPSKGRGDGPGPTIESVLLREVDRCQARLDAALEDLRRYRLSNPAPATASVYETRAAHVFTCGMSMHDTPERYDGR